MPKKKGYVGRGAEREFAEEDRIREELRKKKAAEEEIERLKKKRPKVPTALDS